MASSTQPHGTPISIAFAFASLSSRAMIFLLKASLNHGLKSLFNLEDKVDFPAKVEEAKRGWVKIPPEKIFVRCLQSGERARSLLKDGDDCTRLAGLAFMFSASILLQILACAIYNNWWPMLSALMYVLVPMPCLFFGGGSTQFLMSRDGGGWIDAAKFLTGASAVGSIAIPIILKHAHMIETGAMLIELVSFFIFICTVLCFHQAGLDDDW
ncbi:Vacuolar protein sorting-associated protein 55 like [Glycine soja]|nr:Vacuolar protein sorting-associated protein 55 like [Glycine soja]